MDPAIPASITVDDLAAVSARVGERTGWSFAAARAVSDPAPWMYTDVVAEAGEAARLVLDVGTGGGEQLAVLVGAMRWPAVVAVDHQQSMVEVAARTLEGVASVVLAEASEVPLRSGVFDLVLNRHSSVVPSEVARLLRPGGRFVTQQVGGRNAQSLFDAFGWGSNREQFASETPPPRSCREVVRELEELGLRVDRLDEHEGGYAFADLDSLVFFLKAAPFPEELDPERHVDGVNHLLATAVTDRGIETTEHRELLVATRL